LPLASTDDAYNTVDPAPTLLAVPGAVLDEPVIGGTKITVADPVLAALMDTDQTLDSDESRMKLDGKS
jgi:hypothetical protein